MAKTESFLNLYQLVFHLNAFHKLIIKLNYQPAKGILIFG